MLFAGLGAARQEYGPAFTGIATQHPMAVYGHIELEFALQELRIRDVSPNQTNKQRHSDCIAASCVHRLSDLVGEFDDVADQGYTSHDRPGATFELRGTGDVTLLVETANIHHSVSSLRDRSILKGDDR